MTDGDQATAARILVVEDDEAARDLLRDALGRRGFEVALAETGARAIELFERDFTIDLVLADLNLAGGMSGLDVCRRVLDARPGVPVVVMTAFGSNEAALEAIGAGAHDFITKPFDLDVVSIALDRATRYGRLSREVARLRESLDADGELIGTSEPMRRVKALVGRLADSDVTVLIGGESGTGKELVARALHRTGKRREGPFVAINCAALPETLLESELFGHHKGAFTDARTARPGLFARASGGTLFLDEVGELSAAVQAKLLRALQERVIRPVGSEVEVPFDTRIVAATNRDLEDGVRSGAFREDLYYRLAVVEIVMPPLRARGDDVVLLAHHLLRVAASRAAKRVEGFAPDALARLSGYPFPGNVRELSNAIEHAVALAAGSRVTVDDLPARLARPTKPPPLEGLTETALAPLEEVERRHALRVLEVVGGKRSRAAEILGIDRKTLYRKLERWGVSGPEEDG